MKHRILIPVAVATCLAGCREQAPPVAVVPEEPVAVVVPPAPEGLRRAVEPAFEMAVPAGVTLERRDRGVRHYRISAEWDDLEEFFARELGSGYARTAFSRGARFEATDGSGRAVYLHRERSADAWVLTYFDASDAQPNSPATAASASAGPGLGLGGSPPSANPVAPIPDGTASRDRPAVASTTPSEVTGSAARVATPDPSTLARAQEEWRDSYRSRLQEEFGAPMENLEGAPEPTYRALGGPRVHPRLRGLVSEGGGGRQPINFVRGVREDRGNPNAEF